MLNKAGIPQQHKANYSGPRVKYIYIKKNPDEQQQQRKQMRLLTCMAIKKKSEDGQTHYVNRYMTDR